MTNPDTPLDLDALTALEKAATPAPWSLEHEGGCIVFGPESSVAEADPADAALIVAMRNQWPVLLSELAAARAELAELTEHAAVLGSAGAALEQELAAAREQAKQAQAELGSAKARISAAVNVQVWTNEDGKRFVFADDLLTALDPNPEATPTAAPNADEPKPHLVPEMAFGWRELPLLWDTEHARSIAVGDVPNEPEPYFGVTMRTPGRTVPIAMHMKPAEFANLAEQINWLLANHDQTDALPAAAPDAADTCGHQHARLLRQPGDRPILCTLPAGHDGDHGEPETESHWDRDSLFGAVATSDPRRVDAAPVPAGGEDGSGTADGNREEAGHA